MPDIYTDDWYAAVQSAINSKLASLKDVPDGTWTARIEIVGDGTSPYVDGERHFLVRIESGQCPWYREVQPGDDHGHAGDLDYRFRGPATVFDEIAAGARDPIDAALRGDVKVRGDMRFLMRQAELVNKVLEAYATDVQTSWPAGEPPYVKAEAVNA